MKNYVLLPDLLLRTPLLPYSDLLQQLTKNTTSSSTLKYFFQQGFLQESLFLASPILHQKCLQWLNGTWKNDEERANIENSLWRYLLRMSTRCTPFGLFAGCFPAIWSSKTEIRLEAPPHLNRLTRLDMHYLYALSQYLAHHPDIYPQLLLFPNSSIYVFSDKVRYVEYHYENGVRVHKMSEIENSAYFQLILEASKKGATPNTLTDLLQQQNIEKSASDEFVQALVHHQLLVSELEPSLTGIGMLHQMIKTLETLNEKGSETSPFIVQTLSQLRQIDHHLHQLDDLTDLQPYAIYETIIEIVQNLGVAFELKKLFQVDMAKIAPRHLIDQQLAGQVRKALEILHRLTFSHPKSSLEEFKRAFFERYETQEVPLLQALDVESGIGYVQHQQLSDASALLEKIANPTEEVVEKVVLDEVQLFLFKTYMAAIEQEKYEVVLEEKEIEHLPSEWENFPTSFSVLGSIIGGEEETKMIYLSNVGGSSAANLLGRFTHLHPEIDALAKKITTKEQDLFPEALLAEIVHLPEARTGNILLRTQLRTYEIPFLAKSSLAEEQQISLQDLFISIKNNRLILRSKKLNKEIIPRLSTAHNFSSSNLPVYQFLCDLQQQNPGQNLAFNWGKFATKLDFLPRLRFQNVILFRATWRLTQDHLQQKFTKHDFIEGTPQLEAWKKEFKIPQYVVIIEGDNELWLDLKQPTCRNILWLEVQKRKVLAIREWLFQPNSAVVKDQHDANYTNEFIMGFIKKEEQHRPTFTIPDTHIQRSFAPGSKWLYFKFYIGTSTADRLLSQILWPLSQHLYEKKWIKKFFFIRFADPKWHLRFRFLLSDEKDLAITISTVYEYLQIAFQKNWIWKTQIDTYEREMERYGASTMELSESIFWEDSKTTLNILETIHSFENSELLRYLYGVAMMDILLNSFDYSLEQKIELTIRMTKAFDKEFQVEKTKSNRQISEVYRNYKEGIEEIISEGYAAVLPDEMVEILDVYVANLRPLVQKMLEVYLDNNLPKRQLTDWVSSFIHMSINRLFRTEQRKYEWILYHFIKRAYFSLRARK